jgi:cytidylate kinase
MRKPIVAIDGPSGAGKGTIARAIAAKLGYHHVDSGAMYRAVGWLALRDGVALEDEGAVANLADQARMTISPSLVTIGGEDVTYAIRTPEIDRAAAAVARLPRVRQTLVARQREYGASGGIVMEGRDIGTVVFPDAEVKLYLDASPEERARRRAADPAHSAHAKPLTEVGTALAARDELDRTRTASPLYAASDAILVDTTGKAIEKVVEEVMAIIEQAIGAGPTGSRRDGARAAG